MNERINNLFGQALDEAVPETWTTLNADQLSRLKEKFAELIVRECVAICQNIDGEDNIDAKSGRQDCAVEIQEHFGVKE